MSYFFISLMEQKYIFMRFNVCSAELVHPCHKVVIFFVKYLIRKVFRSFSLNH